MRTAYLRVEGAPGVAQVVGAAQDEAREDFFLLDALQPQLEVLPGTRVVSLHVVAQQAQNLHRVLQRSHFNNSISDPQTNAHKQEMWLEFQLKLHLFGYRISLMKSMRRYFYWSLV